MTKSTAPGGATTIGYLSALETPEHGFFGGYLLVSALGRPVEFHCTAPVQPSRAQQILYGPTLQPYLLGEQIAGALLAKAQAKPQLVVTDQPAVLCQRAKSACPLVCLSNASAAAGIPAARQIVVAEHWFELAAGYEHDRSFVAELIERLAEHVDLPEPFARIHEAIREAQRIGQGADSHGAAA